MTQKLYTLYRSEETSLKIANEFDSVLDLHYPEAYIRRINFGNIEVRDIDGVAVILIKRDVPLVEMIGQKSRIKSLKPRLEKITGFQLREQ